MTTLLPARRPKITLRLKPRDRAEVYDKLVLLADKMLKRMSACSSCPIQCKSTLLQFHYSKSWCCDGCPHLGSTGCTVQALGCKLHICAAEKRRQPYYWKYRLWKLQMIAYHYQIYQARADKKESLANGDKDFWYTYHIHRGH